MKNILIIQQSLVGGGAERVLIDLLRNFDYERFSVSLILIFNEGVYIKDVPHNVRVSYLFSTDKSPLYRFFLHLPYFIQKIIISRKIRGEYDTIISFMEGLTLKFHSYILKKSKNNISWVHTDLINNNWPVSCGQIHSLAEEACYYKQLNTIVFVSDAAKRQFNKLFSSFNLGAVSLKTIYNIVDTERIQQLAGEKKIEHNRFTICTIGRLVPQKRHDRLISAVRIAVDAGCDLDLWIIGQGEKEDSLRKQITELGLEGRVSLLGFMDNPFPYLEASDLFVLSSDSEGYSLVVCEALVLGKPIVSTRVTGPEELLGNSEFGILTELNAQALANQIIYLYNHPLKIIDIKKKSLERSTLFSKKDILQSIYHLI